MQSRTHSKNTRAVVTSRGVFILSTEKTASKAKNASNKVTPRADGENGDTHNFHRENKGDGAGGGVSPAEKQ